MKKRWKRKCALLSAMILLGTLLCGNMALAATYPKQDEADGNRILPLYAEELAVGDFIAWVPEIIIPEGYTFYVNNEMYGPLTEPDYKTLNNVLITSYEKNDNEKYFRITTASAGTVYMPVEKGFAHIDKEVGATVTCMLPKWMEKENFKSWSIIEHQNSYENGQMWWGREVDISAELGLTKEDLQQESISFTLTEEHRFPYVYILKKDGNTVSGNVVIPETPSGSQDSTASSGNSNTESSTPNTVRPADMVQSSDGKVIASASQMSYHADGVKGAAIITPQADVNAAAGLSAADVADRVHAKFYIGDVYDKDTREALNNAVTQTGGTVACMLNIDLYTISWSGRVTRVTDAATEEDRVNMVFGIPDYLLKDGRTFSLVGVKNGKIIEIPDMDQDPRTLSADFNWFGAYAVIYR